VGGTARGRRNLVASGGLADNGDLAILADTKPNGSGGCANLAIDPIESVLHVSGATITDVALAGGNSPIGGSVYDDFRFTPLVNASGNVAFTAKLTGLVPTTAVFLWDGVTTTTVVQQGDFSPQTGGSFVRFSDVAFANGDVVFVKSKFKGTTNKEGVIRFDPTSSSVQTNADTPPTPFVGAAYRAFGDLLGVSHDGAQVALVPKVKDGAPPTGKEGVLRCAE